MVSEEDRLSTETFAGKWGLWPLNSPCAWGVALHQRASLRLDGGFLGRGYQVGRSPSRGDRLQASDSFYLSLEWQEETSYKCQIFPSLCKFKKRFLLKFCVAMIISGST